MSSSVRCASSRRFRAFASPVSAAETRSARKSKPGMGEVNGSDLKVLFLRRGTQYWKQMLFSSFRLRASCPPKPATPSLYIWKILDLYQLLGVSMMDGPSTSRLHVPNSSLAQRAIQKFAQGPSIMDALRSSYVPRSLTVLLLGFVQGVRPRPRRRLCQIREPPCARLPRHSMGNEISRKWNCADMGTV